MQSDRLVQATQPCDVNIGAKPCMTHVQDLCGSRVPLSYPVSLLLIQAMVADCDWEAVAWRGRAASAAHKRSAVAHVGDADGAALYDGGCGCATTLKLLIVTLFPNNKMWMELVRCGPCATARQLCRITSQTAQEKNVQTCL